MAGGKEMSPVKSKTAAKASPAATKQVSREKAIDMMSKSIALKPRMSEKTYALAQSENTFVFVVPGSANKMTVAGAVEAQFGVTVEDVRIMIEKGKIKQARRKRSRPVSGKRPDRKKAYVRVKQEDNIPIFAAVEEAEKKAQKAEAKAKKKEQK
jgi:large subunit ribosomal protein L23